MWIKFYLVNLFLGMYVDKNMCVLWDIYYSIIYSDELWEMLKLYIDLVLVNYKNICRYLYYN